MLIDLNNIEKNIVKNKYSQNDEDYINVKIIETLEKNNIDLCKYYVEFGVEDGMECNTRILLMEHNWNGLLMDGGYENKNINLKKEFIMAENILSLFKKHIPKKFQKFDLLCIDIDGNDFYIWKTISTLYKPKIVIIEFNHTFGLYDVVIKYDKEYVWTKKTNYYGASMMAYYKLGKSIGYTLIYSNGVNLWFIRDDVINELKNKEVYFKHEVKTKDDLKTLYGIKDERSYKIYSGIKYRAGFKNVDPTIMSGYYYNKYLKAMKDEKIYQYLPKKK